MIKLSGCIITVLSATLFFSRKVLENFFTYRFMDKAMQIVQQMNIESDGSMPYSKLFERIGFESSIFIGQAEKNVYVNKKYIEEIKRFFDNLGKRNSKAEKQYVLHNLNIMEHRRDRCYREYTENRKTHIMCGAAVGFLTVIFLI